MDYLGDNDLPDNHPLRASQEKPRPVMNRAARRQAERNTPLDDMKVNEAVSEVSKGLANFFKPKPARYTSVLKSLEQLELEPKMMHVMIGEESVQCFVIPVQELVFKEWQLMSGAQYKIATGEE